MNAIVKTDAPDGIHFGMDDTLYHSLPRLSASGIKWMMVSPMDFWARSWMNQRYRSEATSFMEAGTAYHKRILEGRTAFYAAYAPELDPADYPDALRTADQIKDELRSRSEKLTGNKPDLIERLRLAAPEVDIWDVLVSDYAKANASKTLLSFSLIQEIEMAAAMIERHPQLSKCFQAGYPEVTILWHDAETGVPMKSRLDYLKSKAIVDLKTFGNALNKPIDRAIAQAMAQGKYHVQAAVYYDALTQAQRLAMTGAVFGEVDRAWLSRMAPAQEHQFVFCFQQTGIAPVARGKVFPRSLVYGCGEVAAREAIMKFAQCTERFGSDPWIDVEPIGSFDDTEFPVWMTE